MKLLLKFGLRYKIVEELISFLWQRKLWWLIPFVVILLAIGIICIITQSSGVAPFIYTLF